MGEYADDAFRKEVKQQYGFDPGSMYQGIVPTVKKQKIKCAVCGKKVVGIFHHQRDAHGIRQIK